MLRYFRDLTPDQEFDRVQTGVSSFDRKSVFGWVIVWARTGNFKR